ncbi:MULTISPECIES: hypothetical protein [Galbibacter]|uniref:Uncharacterized protein n=1 Tax=Galbibacter pacificus TaxID=2996052 RepID=A0ABT6FNI7_9FLAO|nr:hypothetical protein [Galbibacter pacificus]MDG3581345.1 hypothetical protein [Galbibacter pacificus]MDG3584823.1 hypothetical protein [Galbibacter pacificus]
MRLPTLFKQRSAKGYSYTPRYYDERKERLEELKKSKENRSNEDYFKGYRRKSYREDWKSTRKPSVDTNSRFRFIVILILLLMFAMVAVRYINLDKLF